MARTAERIHTAILGPEPAMIGPGVVVGDGVVDAEGIVQFQISHKQSCIMISLHVLKLRC